jgi:hypothetical protein
MPFRPQSHTRTVWNPFQGGTMRSLTIIAFAFLLVMGMSGCGPRDEIRTYNAPRDNPGDKAHGTGGESKEKMMRLLGLIIPKSTGESWFVKFSGPAEQIEPHVAAFDAFVGSLRVAAGAASPSYTSPPGWKEAPPRAMRIATFLPPGEGKQPELYLSQPFGGSLLDNVNRWRGEVGLPPVRDSELPSVVTEVMLGDVKAYRVDFTGPGGKSRMPPFAQ